MDYRRMPIEIESPEQLGYDRIKCNLTESSMPDMKFDALGLDFSGLTLAYTDHAGDPELRKMIAAEGEGLRAEDVLATPGAAAALFIIATSMLGANDRILVAHPNYATNIETPRAIGCGVDLLELRFEDGFSLDISRLRSMITPQTKLISLTTPHNPTGTALSEKQIREAAEIAERSGCLLLVDETYRDMAFDGPAPLAASISPSAISVSSLSKTYGLPGIRVGWIISKNAALMETFLAAKEQMVICGSALDERAAVALMRRKKEFQADALAHIKTAFGATRDWMASQNNLEWVEPCGGVVCFPRIKPALDIDIDEFYRILNEEYGTYVGPGHWFGMDRRHMRIGYGWPKPDELAAGLQNITRAVARARRKQP
ncbi:MAG TPA: pyridoxal phosphate-dependent aminotransferase [bacterium]|nr:pyridoxal phosphate-dependent aminotransferase [bacterium]